MAIKLAKRYLLVFPKKEGFKPLILKTLEDNGEVEIEKIQEREIAEDLSQRISQLTFRISSAQFAIGYLAPYEQKKLSFLQKLTSSKISIEKAEKERFKKNAALEAITKRVGEIEKEKEILSRERKETTERTKQIEKFSGLDFLPVQTKYTESLLFSLPQGALQKLKENVGQYDGVYLKEIQRAAGKVILLLIVLQSNREKILAGIKELKGESVNYEFDRLPGRILADLDSKQKGLEIKEKQLEKELAERSSSLKALKIYHDLLIVERTKLGMEAETLTSTFVDCLSFYSLPENKDILAAKLKELSREISIIETKLEKENLPVVLENNKLIGPLQYVTEIFGLPRPTEIDPTPFLAFFFVVFFGICLTDAGYGIFLCLATILALLLFKKKFGDSKLIKLLFYGGAATTVMGVLFGSYFGVDAGAIKFLPFLKNIKKIDPLKDTLLFMGLSFALGYFQIFVSQIVRIISGARNKNADFIARGSAWALLYIFGAVLFLATKFPALKDIGYYGIAVSALAVVFCEAKGVNIFLKPLVGTIKFLQGLIGTMSDVLSYSRLMALGLATGVIALIINQIAMMFKDMIPVFGWVVAGLVLLGGHTFNLGINALSGFIHSGRLQFVEFFPKFLEGGGRRFKPTKAELKYIEFH